MEFNSELIKSIGDLGVGLAAIAGLIFIIVQQISLIKSLGELVNNNTKSIDQNTAVTSDLKTVINGLCDKLNTTA
jgi:hypothetical protein